MDSGGLSDLDLSELQQYLGHTDFPADKQEVASNAGSNQAPQAVVARIRNFLDRALRQPRGGAAGGARALERRILRSTYTKHRISEPKGHRNDFKSPLHDAYTACIKPLRV
jgi:hypothetical protein